jgi:hypothetical protein
MYAAALAEDPNAFDYDGVYDSIQQERAAPKAQDKVARQPKYIANLLEQAQLRKREQDITNERRLVSVILVACRHHVVGCVVSSCQLSDIMQQCVAKGKVGLHQKQASMQK